jgi:hypothetical protein
LIFKGFGALLLEADSLFKPLFFFWIISSAIVFPGYIALPFGILCTTILTKKGSFTLAMASVFFLLFRIKKDNRYYAIVFVLMLKSHLF